MVNINTSKSSEFGAGGIAADDPLMELSRIIGLQEPAREPVTNDEDLALDLERELLTTLDEEPLVEFVQADESVTAWRETLLPEATEVAEPFSEAALDFDFSEALEQEMQPSTFVEEQPYAPVPDEPAYQQTAPEAYAAYETAAPEPVSAPASLEDELEALLGGGEIEPAPRSAGTFGYSLANFGVPRTAERSEPAVPQAAAPETVPVAAPVVDEVTHDDLAFDDAAFSEALQQDAEAEVPSVTGEDSQNDSFIYDAETDRIFGLHEEQEAVADADGVNPAVETVEYGAAPGEDFAVADPDAAEFKVEGQAVDPVLAESDYIDKPEEQLAVEPQSDEFEWNDEDFALTEVLDGRTDEEKAAAQPFGTEQVADVLPAAPQEWRLEDAGSEVTGRYFSAHEALPADPQAEDVAANVEADRLPVLDEEFTGADTDFNALSFDVADLQLATDADTEVPDADTKADIDPADLDAFAREFEAFHLPEDEDATVAVEADAEQGWNIAEEVSEPSYDGNWPSYSTVQASDEFQVEASGEGHVVGESTPDDQLFAGFADELNRSVSSLQPGPTLETVSLDETVEITDNLDIPEVEYVQDSPVAGDQLESDFAEVFAGVEETSAVQQQPEPAPAAPADAQDSNFDDLFADIFGNGANVDYQQASAPAGYAGAVAAGAAIAATGAVAGGSYAANSAVPDYGQRSRAPANEPDFAYDPNNLDDEDLVIPPDSAVYQNRPARSRGLMIAGALGCLAAVGIAGAYAYSWMSGGSSEPVVIHADNSPIKVQPENPGGKAVPNQDKAVYDSVAGMKADKPSQERLISNREEPVDLAAQAKTEERVEQPTDVAMAPPPAETNVMAPRRVQTVIVRPDGTIVQPDPAPAAPEASAVARPETRPSPNVAPIAAGIPEEELAGLEPINEEAGLDESSEVAAQSPDQNGTVTGATQPAATAPVRTVQTQTFTPESTAAPAPKNVPVVPSRPADQPLTIVDRAAPANEAPAPTQVASAAAAGGYVIQIASQPSADAARKSYADLSRRHANLIGGRGVDIQQAEIAGRGTFYRVRIPAGSKDDAINLCTKYKAAGGACLVTR